MNKLSILISLLFAILSAPVMAIQVEDVKHYVGENNQSLTRIALQHEGNGSIGGVVTLEGAPSGFTVSNSKSETGTIILINHGMKLLANFNVAIEMDDGVEVLNEVIPVTVNRQIKALSASHNSKGVKLKSIDEIENEKQQAVQRQLAIQQRIIEDQRIAEQRKIEANRKAQLAMQQAAEAEKVRLAKESEIKEMENQARLREAERLAEIKRLENEAEQKRLALEQEAQLAAKQKAELVEKEKQIKERENELLKQKQLQLASIKKAEEIKKVEAKEAVEEVNEVEKVEVSNVAVSQVQNTLPIVSNEGVKPLNKKAAKKGSKLTKFESVPPPVVASSDELKSEVLPEVASIESAEPEKKRSMADFKHRLPALELVKRFFKNSYQMDVLYYPKKDYVEDRKQSFVDQEPVTVAEAAKLLDTKFENIVLDPRTKTVVINPDFSKLVISDPVINSDYGSPIQMKMALIHNPNEDVLGGINALNEAHQLNGNVVIREIPTTYGTLVEIHGEEVVNNSFYINVNFRNKSGTATHSRDLLIQPKFVSAN